MSIILITSAITFLALFVFSLCKSSKMGDTKQKVKIIVIAEGKFELMTENSFQELEEKLHQENSQIQGYILDIHE